MYTTYDMYYTNMYNRIVNYSYTISLVDVGVLELPLRQPNQEVDELAGAGQEADGAVRVLPG